MLGHRVLECDLEGVHPEYLCPSCGRLIRNAVQAGCGDLYCQACFNNVKSHEDNPVCIKCRKPLMGPNNQGFADNCVRREILEKTVYCLNKLCGCTWRGRLRDREAHHDECPYRKIPCTVNGCNYLIPAHILNDHEENCPNRRKQCEYCDSVETVASLLEHLKSCPNVPVGCPNCGRANMPRIQLKGHLDPINGDCLRKQCPLAEYGCTHGALMDQDMLKRHLGGDFMEHLLLLQRFVEERFPRSDRENMLAIAENRRREDLTAAEVADHKWALGEHYKWLVKLGDDMRGLFHALALVKAQEQQDFAELQATVATLSQEVANLRDRLADFETRTADQYGRLNTQLEFNRALTTAELRCYPQTPRQNEIHSFDGTLIWRITELEQILQEAQNNPDRFLSSPTFCTSRHGYKMRVCLYLNGHGREWDSKISFLLEMVDGEYDPVLEWPFSCPTEFRLMGQGNSRGIDMVQPFQADPADASFSQPVPGRTTVHFCDSHVAFPVRILRDRGYVVDDTMVVKVVVREK